MSTINYTYNVIVDRFRQFAAGHFQLRRFTHGEISQADLEKEAEWPWLHVKPRAINYSPGTRSFSFEIFISDLPRDKEDKTGYQAESITDCSLIFQDLINEIYLGNMFGSDVVLTRPVSSEPFVEQYTHTLTGVTGTIELNLDYDWSACSIPASWNYNTPTDSPSDGWGALQFIDSLDQNGVYVSLLNDEEAPGNSYYYGTNSSGVKGWYAIVDNVGLTCETLPDCATIISIVDDIAALQTDKVDKIAGKGLSTEDYTTAEKSKLAGIEAGAEVNVNADWNATSGDAQILNKPTIPSISGLVPETRTLTINGTTQDLSANRTFTIATGLTVGSTAITSGTVGRVLFEGTGNVLQESANFFWDNTNSRLGIGTASPTVPLEINGNQRNVNLFTSTSLTENGLYLANTTEPGFYSANVSPSIVLEGKSKGGTTSIVTKARLGFIPNLSSIAGGEFRVDVWNGTAYAQIFGVSSNGTFTLPADSNSQIIYSGSAANSIVGPARHRFTTGGPLIGSTGVNTSLVGIVNTYNPTAGAGSEALLRIFPTINQTGTATGIFRGLQVDPTMTAITATGNWRSIEWTNNLGWGLYGSGTALNYLNGSVLIGTTTDAGYKLDVNGSVRFGTNFTWNNTSNLLTVTGLLTCTSQVRAGQYLIGGTLFASSTSNLFWLTGGTAAGTSGILNSYLAEYSYSPTSGTQQMNVLNASPTINQTGTATGITRGLYVNPTITAAADFRAIHTTRGKIVFENLPTSIAGLPTGALWNDAGTVKIV